MFKYFSIESMNDKVHIFASCSELTTSAVTASGNVAERITTHVLGRNSRLQRWRGRSCRVAANLPETEKDSTGVLPHLVIRNDVCKLPSHISYVLQDWVALLPFVHKDGIGVDLHYTCTNVSLPAILLANTLARYVEVHQARNTYTEMVLQQCIVKC